MFKLLLAIGFVAIAAASPAYYGYAQPKYAPKYSEVPKASASYSHGGGYGGGHGGYGGGHGGGYGGGYGYEKPNPYEFGYHVDDGYGNNHHQNEEGDDYGNKKGSYGYTDAYGIYRKVDYVADGHGFRAYVSTNEPGTANQDPADVKMYAKDQEIAHYGGGNKYGGGYGGHGYGHGGSSYGSSYGSHGYEAPKSYGGHGKSYGGHGASYGHGGSSYGHGGSYGGHGYGHGGHSGYDSVVSHGSYGGHGYGGNKGGYGGGYGHGGGYKSAGYSKQHFAMKSYDSRY